MLLDVKCEAKARPVGSVGVVWVTHVVLDVFNSLKLFPRVWVVATFEIRLALEDKFKLCDDTGLDIVVVLDVADGSVVSGDQLL